MSSHRLCKLIPLTGALEGGWEHGTHVRLNCLPPLENPLCPTSYLEQIRAVFRAIKHQDFHERILFFPSEIVSCWNPGFLGTCEELLYLRTLKCLRGEEGGRGPICSAGHLHRLRSGCGASPSMPKVHCGRSHQAST